MFRLRINDLSPNRTGHHSGTFSMNQERQPDKHGSFMMWTVLSSSLVLPMIGFWHLHAHLPSLSVWERIVRLILVSVGWYVAASKVVLRLFRWWERRGESKLVREAQPMEIMNVRCEICDCDEFLEGPHGGLCTNIKCVQCSAEYNYGPGIMERIL